MVGHRCLVVSAVVGDLCEIGKRVGAHAWRPPRRSFLGEGTVVPGGATLPSDVVAVGRPARIVRIASPDDLRRLTGLRGGDLTIPPSTSVTVEATHERNTMGQLHEYRGIVPTVAGSAILFPTAELTGDVVVGERTIIAAGVGSSATRTDRCASATTYRSSRTACSTSCPTTTSCSTTA